MHPNESPTTSPAKATVEGEDKATPEKALSRILGKLSGLSPDTAEAIARIATIQRLDADETLFNEGDVDNSLFVLLSGELKLTRVASQSEVHLGIVGPGDFLGDLSFLDAGSRQATAQAGTVPTVVAKIDPLTLLLTADGDRHYDGLRTALVVPVTRAFRQQAKNLVLALEERQRFSGFFIYMIAILYGCMLIYFLVAERFVEDTTTNLFAWQSAAVLVIPSLFAVRRLRLGRADVGLRSEDLRRSAVAGLVWGLAVAVAIVGAFVSARAAGLLPEFERVQAFDPLDLVLYLPHTFVQEFVARGLIQNGYRRFFDDRTGYRAVVFASLVFGVAHIPLGILAVAITFIGGLIFGFFFLRYPHLVGVTILHYFLGASAITLGLI